jgi:hypothetical protein
MSFFHYTIKLRNTQILLCGWRTEENTYMNGTIILLKRIFVLYSISQDIFINGSTYNKIKRNLI